MSRSLNHWLRRRRVQAAMMADLVEVNLSEQRLWPIGPSRMAKTTMCISLIGLHPPRMNELARITGVF